MSYIGHLFVVAMALVIPSLASAECGSIAGTSSRIIKGDHDGQSFVLAEYITREEQQRRAEENLRRHREQQDQNSVQQSTPSIHTEPLTPNTDNQQGNR